MNIMICRGIPIIVLLLSCIACIQQNPEPQKPVPQLPLVQLPVIEEFSGNMLRTGYIPCELKWRVTGASSIHINKGIGKVDSTGTRKIYPSEDTIYTLTATNEAGSVNKPTVIYAYRYCPGLPEMEGYSKYIDDINIFGLVYPSSWIIEQKHFSDSEGNPSGVLLSNGKTGMDYAYYDISIESKEPSFDKRAFADKYKDEHLARGYNLIYDKTVSLAGDESTITQMYNRISDNQSYDHGAIFVFYNYDKDRKLWAEMYEWPHNRTEYNIRNCFTHCPHSRSFE